MVGESDTYSLAHFRKTYLELFKEEVAWDKYIERFRSHGRSQTVPAKNLSATTLEVQSTEISKTEHA